MTEQPTPNGPAASRPVPDLGFFAPVGPARSQLPPPNQHAAPPNQFDPPRSQYTAPPGQFGAAPVTPFGAGPPAVYAPYPATQQQGGMPGWAIALIAVGVSGFIVMVLAAIAIPTFLDQRAKATAAATTVALPETVEGLERLRTPDAEAVIQEQLDALPMELLKDGQGAVYTDGDLHTIVVQVARFRGVVEPRDVDAAITGFHRGLTSDLPPGVTASDWQDRPSGSLGGRISCATLQGNMTGQACAAVESSTLLGVLELTPSSSIDPDLPRRVREAVVQRR